MDSERTGRRFRPSLGSGPVTTVGAATATLGTASYIAGWQLGWIELLVVAAACLAALLIALPFIVGRSSVEIDRVLEHDRISVGEHVDVRLVASNPGRTPNRRLDVEERVGSGTLDFVVPTLGPGKRHEIPYRLTPPRRTRLVLGPAVLSRSDPLGLLRRSVPQSSTDVCWVYPRTEFLAPLPVGFAKDLEGPTSDASPAGDVAFHAVRPYTTGDDRRHIHWLSTAKTGELMVRHYVDNRRPHLAVFLDVADHEHDDATFETSVSCAASLAASMLDQRLPVSLRLGPTTVMGARRPGDRHTALEALTECSVERSPADELALEVAEFVRLERSTSAVAIVTARRSAVDLLATVVHARRHARVIIVSTAPDGEGIVALPGARVIQAPDLSTFAHGWAAMVG